MSNLLKLLSAESGLPETAVSRIIATAPDRYKTYSISKRNGGRREISQPAKELKLLQRAFVAAFLVKLPVHRAAMAYRQGLSIRSNALAHAEAGPILKMDFKDFFPSIVASDWVSYCKRTGCITDSQDLHISSNLLFHRPRGGRVLRLAIGAPSSPILSNILMYEFDEIVEKCVAPHKVKYTRYADDLTFSGPRTGHLTVVHKSVQFAIREIKSPRLRINHGKTNFVTKKYHRQVTGLVLSNDGRVTIGRDRKRSIRAAIHNYKNGQFPRDELAALAGLLAFVKSAEPEHFFLLKERYGTALIEQLLSEGAREAYGAEK